MIPYPRIDPEIFRIGPFAVRWYGMMYVLGFASSYGLVLYQLKKKAVAITKAQIDDIYFYLVLGLLVGARLGYVLFYNLPYYVGHPLEIFVLWHGGMSFHGGAAGTFLLGYWAMRRRKVSFLQGSRPHNPHHPFGPLLRKNRQFHQWGALRKAAGVPWAMIFPSGGHVPRHPSQLYEALLEGLVLFAILLAL